ncbi:MAG: BON domain-containing protein [Pseudomonadota bacterium]
MSKQLSLQAFSLKLFFVGILNVFLLNNLAFAEDSLTQNINDARREAQIWTTYALNRNLQASELSVTVHGNKATLSGKVEEGVSKELAEQIALGVEGISSIDNQIVVDADYTSNSKPTKNRAYGKKIEDFTISATIKSKLLWSKHADGLSVAVDTKDGVVTLSGTAQTDAARDLAEQLANNTAGVVSVNNLLKIKGQLGQSPSQQASEKISDAWITTKVKSTLLYSTEVKGSAISVKTENGIVTLSGNLRSDIERDLAIQHAKNVRGVKEVVAKELKTP